MADGENGGGDNGGDGSPAPGDIFEFEELNQLLAQQWDDIGEDLWRSDLFIDDHALSGLLGDVGEGAGGYDGKGSPNMAEHLQDHVRQFPIKDAVAAGAFLALIRSRTLGVAPRFFLRVEKRFRVLVGPLEGGKQLGVIASVPPDWPFLASKALPVPELAAQFSAFEAAAFDIEPPLSALPS